VNDSKPLHDVLAEVFSADEPAVGIGPAAVFTRAARIRTRQRITVALTATAIATAAVVVGAASLAVRGPARAPVAGPDSDSAHPTTATATPSPVAKRTGPRQVDFDIQATLTRLLPLSNSIEDVKDEPGFAAVNITDPQGTTRIEVNVDLDAAGVESIMVCTRTLPAGTQCNVTTQPDGAQLRTREGPNLDGPPSIRALQVALLYPDGRWVVVSEWNAVDYVSGPATRRTPLLSIDQLVTLATAPDWRM
jgi:hypothetical protein